MKHPAIDRLRQCIAVGDSVAFPITTGSGQGFGTVTGFDYDQNGKPDVWVKVAGGGDITRLPQQLVVTSAYPNLKDSTS